MKGITPIISIIILLMVTITLAGAAYTFIMGYGVSGTSKLIDILKFQDQGMRSSVYVVNMGTADIMPGEIKVLVDGAPVRITNPSIIRKGSTGELKFVPNEFGKFVDIVVIGPSNIVTHRAEYQPESVDNFLYNGDFEMGGINWNFYSSSGIQSSDVHSGANATLSTGNAYFMSSELVPVEQAKNLFTIDFFAKSVGTGGLSKIYAGFLEYDKDMQFISHPFVQYYENTKTVLAAPLNPGDSVVQIINSANWKGSSEPYYNRAIGFWNTGDYPDYTYTRTLAYYSGISGNTLTLCTFYYCNPTTWTGPAIPAGTPVANMWDGSTYNYVAAAWADVPVTWTHFSGSVSGWKFGNEDTYNKFRFGTKYVQAHVLANYAQESTFRLVVDDMKVTQATQPAKVYTSCLTTLYNGSSVGDGFYTIDPDGPGGDPPIQVYCDMTTMGGGWTLALLNSPYPAPPKPNWNDAVNGNTFTGTRNESLMGFDQFLGVKHWNRIGNTLKLETGTDPSHLSHRATYSFSLNPSNNFALSMSNERVLVNTGGTASAGMYSFHAAGGYQLSTYDADHDTYGSNCATYYGNTPWWYDACWSGNFWGGGDSGGYANAAYWHGSGTEYFPWGAIWIR